MFKQNKDQNTLAANLETVLLVISGLRDGTREIENDIENQKWMMCGVYEEETGHYYLREGEHVQIQKHFDQLHVNRL